MYVAATRAKENLFITYPINIFDRATGMVLSKPSRFLDGIPRRVLEPMMLMEEDDGRENAWRSRRRRPW
jgi:DNA helicase-2/ATP-dependent DNA helicase PcrA